MTATNPMRLKLRIDGAGDDIAADVIDLVTDNLAIFDVSLTGDFAHNRDTLLPAAQAVVDGYNRAMLATEVYATVYRNTETFMEGPIGGGLAYLMGAILQGDVYEIISPTSEEAEFLAFIRETFADDHPVFQHIKQTV